MTEVKNVEETQNQETTEQPAPLGAKKRFLDAVGKEVPMDYFLFSCLEHERLLRAIPGHNDHEIHWPVLKADGARTEELQLSNMLGWYKDNFPELTDSRALDAEQSVIVVPKVTAIDHDLVALYRAKSEAGLPPYDKNAPNDAWNEIESAVKTAFPNYAHLFMRYLHWAHGVEVVETFVPGSRPPVGRYAPPMIRTPFGDRGRGGDRGGDRGRSGPRGNDRGGPRGDRPPPRGDRPPPRGDRPPRRADGEGPREERAPREDRGPREDRAPRGDRPPRRDGGGDRDRDRGGRNRRPNDEETSRLTDVALAEVDRAIEMLVADKTLSEVTLKPTNSFYRRIQHQKAIDAGFTSNSTGEGADRAVKVGRRE